MLRISARRAVSCSLISAGFAGATPMTFWFCTSVVVPVAGAAALAGEVPSSVVAQPLISATPKSAVDRRLRADFAKALAKEPCGFLSAGREGSCFIGPCLEINESFDG